MVSKNGIALVVMIIALFGGEVSEEALSTTISTIGQIASLILMIWNQYARGDVDKFIFKK
jgi:hypothetical protein